MIRIEIMASVALDNTLTLAVGGDRLDPEPLRITDEALDTIRQSVAQLEALVPEWTPRNKTRFNTLRRDLGLALGELLFDDSILARELMVALRQIQGRRGVIRLILSFDNPTLSALPWELLIWPHNGEILLGTDPRFTLTRSAHASDPGLRSPATGRPRLLATVSDPESFGLTTPLAPTWDGMVDSIQRHLADSMDIVIAPAEDLSRALDDKSGYSVLFALGHGSQRLQLMLPRTGSGPPFIEVDAATFRDRFARGGTPRLAILIMCYSGGDAAQSVGISAAEAMIDGGCAAVIAMHGSIYLPAAELFVEDLLTHLSAGEPLDIATQFGREALAKYGQENAHKEAPDHAFRPVLVVRQPADLIPLLPKRRSRTQLSKWFILATVCVTLLAFVALWALLTQFRSPSPDSIEIPMVTIPAGHAVRLQPWKSPKTQTKARFVHVKAKSFELAKAPITQRQYSMVMGLNPAYHNHVEDDETLDWPVERVNGYDTLFFLNKLSKINGLSECYQLSECKGQVGTGCAENKPWCVDGYQCQSVTVISGCSGYRLPTQDEWTVAAGAQATSTPRYQDYQSILAVTRQRANSAHEVGPAVHGLKGLSSGRREWAWPMARGRMSGCLCVSLENTQCTYSECWPEKMSLRSQSFVIRPARRLKLKRR